MSKIRWKIPTQLKEITQEQAQATQKAITSELESIDNVINDVNKKLRRAREVNNTNDISTLEEVKRVAYGKSIIIDSDKNGIQEYRVTQAAGTYANTRYGVATALSPMGTLCRQAYVGLAGNSKILGKFEVLEVRTFERFKGLTAADNTRNFQAMVRTSFVDEHDSNVEEFYTQDLKSTSENWFGSADGIEAITIGFPPQAEKLEGFGAVSGIEDVGGWDDDDLPDISEENQQDQEQKLSAIAFKDEYFGLSSNFYLNPTKEQYKIMSNTLDTGPMLVEGIAGSGKTCAALGRAKTLVDLAKVIPDENDEYEATDFFAQESSVGIVRTGELVQYLKQTCNELGLSHLPIIEYDELRTRLQQSRELEQRSKTDNMPKYSLSVEESGNDYAETTMAWLESFDKALFDLLLSKVSKVVDQLSFDSNKFEVAKLGSPLMLTRLAKELRLKLQANINQWKSSREKKHFACEDLVSELYHLFRTTINDTVDRKGYWYSVKVGELEFTTSLANVFNAYRSNHFLFMDKQERTCFQVATGSDLTTFIEQCELTSLSIEDALSDIELDTSFDDIWDQLVEHDKSYLIGRNAEGAVFKARVVDIEQLNFLRTEKRLYVRPSLSSSVRLFDLTSPYATVISPNSKGGKPTRFSNYLRSRIIPRLFNHWHIADLYRDTLLLAESEWSNDKSDALNRLVGKQLNAHDVDVLLAMSHIMGTKDDKQYDSVPLRWQSTKYYRSVFVDEVQDFTEIQVFIMGQQASPEYHAVTMVGDMHQQLKQGRAKDLEACFPHRKLSKHLLVENKRQEFHATLGSLSQIFRRVIQGDSRLPDSAEEIQRHLENIVASEGLSFSDTGFDSSSEAILEIIKRQPETRTIAVLTPNLGLAKVLEERLREGLKAVFRESYVSENVQLNKKYQIHFSSPEHIKGLEFDTVILTGLEDVDWSRADEVNGVYVALSRPRKELHILSDLKKIPEKVVSLFKGELTVGQI